MHQFGHIQTYASNVFVLDILISGCCKGNIMKQTDVSTLCIHEKEKGILFVPSLRKLDSKCFHTYKVYFHPVLTILYALTFKL